MDVITRFAPSPTGVLHIGGARTALFNWLYAHHHGGKFLLRLEDTDRRRSTEDAIDTILDGLSWLELTWDDELVRQSERADRHVQIARQLLAEDKAYNCYCTPEELAEMRETARQKGSPVLYDGRWRDRDPDDAPAGIKPTVRIKAPLEGDTIIDDLVQGSVTFANEQLDDMVLLRSNGTPTYMHSVVVDDHDMGITHVIRGDDHLNNAARQKILFNAMNWVTPAFAHIPLIHGPDGAKMSKRHGAIGVAAYREDGYLPEALCNYLVRLGWSHGDDELFTIDQAIEWFDLDHVGRSPSRFDFDKLQSLNSHYIQQADTSRLVKMIRKPLAKICGHDLDTADIERITLAIPEFTKRAKTILQIIDNAKFIVSKRPIEIDNKGAQILTEDARELLHDLITILVGISNWDFQTIETAIRDFANIRDIKLGKIAQPIRVSLTGTTASPGIFELLMILGQEESIGRIEDVAGH